MKNRWSIVGLWVHYANVTVKVCIISFKGQLFVKNSQDNKSLSIKLTLPHKSEKAKGSNDNYR